MILAYESTPHGTHPVSFPDPGKDFCNICGDEDFTSNLIPSYRADLGNIKVCRSCAPDCTQPGCLEPAMPHSEGGYCKHHDAIAEAEIAREEVSNESK